MNSPKKFSIDWNKTMSKINESGDVKKSFKDERIYYPKLKDDGTGSTKIRFLTSPDTDIPWVTVYNHSFQGPGGWYIQNCPTTLKNDCPLCQENSVVWNSNDEETARKITQGKTRKTSYYSNILVVQDPACPENEGKVFLFRYGKKIFEKIMAKLKPTEAILKECYVFDYYDGADFNFIIKRKRIGKQNVANYDDSYFDNPSPVGDDDKIEKIVNQLFSLADFINPDKFLAFNTLKEKYEKVVGTTITSSDRGNSGSSQPTQKTAPKTEPKTTSSLPKEPNVDSSESSSEGGDESNLFEGDDVSFFASLESDSNE